MQYGTSEMLSPKCLHQQSQSSPRPRVFEVDEELCPAKSYENMTGKVRGQNLFIATIANTTQSSHI